MAKATVRYARPAPPPIDAVLLHLSDFEAQVLVGLIDRHVAGRSTARDALSNINSALANAGVTAAAFRAKERGNHGPTGVLIVEDL